MKSQKIITGIKPTGEIHLGNYFGAIKQMVDLQDKGEMFLFLADLHALTNLSEDGVKHDREEFKIISNNIIHALIAFGINPKKTIIYRQSDFPQITELMWIFTCLLKTNFLKIGHAYKDELNKNVELNLGTFMYPVLMTSDILITDSSVVPIGKDQLQHIEIAREIARKFNNKTKSDLFTEPNERVIDEISTIVGTDGEKMSKSKNNTIPIFASEEFITKKIMGIVTDSVAVGKPINPKKCTVCQYIKLFTKENDYKIIENKCFEGKITYKELKELLVKEYFTYFKDIRDKYLKLKKNEKYINKMFAKNKKKLDPIFSKKLDETRSLLGIE